jgi:DNA-binding transcriptional MerR regulator
MPWGVVLHYNGELAACLSGCSPRQLRYWRDTGIIQPCRVEICENGRRQDLYDFRNLVELKTIVGMLYDGISLQKIRKTLSYLRDHTSRSSPLSDCKLVTDGSTIFEICENGEAVLDTLRDGQSVFCIALDGIVEELSARIVELDGERCAFLSSLTASQ